MPKRCCGLVSRSLFRRWGGVELRTVVPSCESETADMTSVRATGIKLTENWCRSRGSKVRYADRCAALAVLRAECGFFGLRLGEYFGCDGLGLL